MSVQGPRDADQDEQAGKKGPSQDAGTNRTLIGFGTLLGNSESNEDLKERKIGLIQREPQEGLREGTIVGRWKGRKDAHPIRGGETGVDCPKEKEVFFGEKKDVVTCA